MLWDVYEMFCRVQRALDNSNQSIFNAVKNDLDNSMEARLLTIREGAEQLIKMIDESMKGK